LTGSAVSGTDIPGGIVRTCIVFKPCQRMAGAGKIREGESVVHHKSDIHGLPVFRSVRIREKRLREGTPAR
jgi:hypothetical protein